MPLWAVIPAAGLGTRMAENAVLGCKELVKVNGITMLEHTIQELEKQVSSRLLSSLRRVSRQSIMS